VCQNKIQGKKKANRKPDDFVYYFLSIIDGQISLCCYGTGNNDHKSVMIITNVQCENFAISEALALYIWFFYE
jgi:hypothetical protein